MIDETHGAGGAENATHVDMPELGTPGSSQAGSGSTVVDRTVEEGDVAIAVRDYGGTGTPILLVHGAGGNLAAWDVLGPMLAAEHRAVAVDLRGHGESWDGPWSWDAAVSDLEAVAAALDLRRPVVVGHSLGGGLAGEWAVRHRDCPAVVNIDGHRSPVAAEEHFDPEAAGIDVDELRRGIQQLAAMFDAQLEAMGAPLTDEQIEAMLTGQRDFAAQAGVDPEPLLRLVRRGLVHRDGGTYLRPGPETARALREGVQSDSLPVYDEVDSPLLVVLATRSLPEVPPELEPLMVAFRAGLRRDLDALIARRPNIRIQEVDASHAVLFEKPAKIAELITDFIAYAAVVGPGR